MYLSEEEKLLKRSIESSLKSFQKLYEELLNAKTSLNNECHNCLSELKRNIDLQREMLKNEIDKIALAMIEQTKQYEASFEKNLKKKCDTIQTQF